MNLSQITETLETFAPLQYQEHYDNAGLIIGNKNSEIKNILICLDVTEEVLDEAITKGCNLIIAHHPIIFFPLKKINGNNFVERIVIKSIQNNISIYAAHTNLDNVKNGVNAKICEKLGLKNCKIISPKKNLLRKIISFCPTEYAVSVRQALFAAGAGHIGEYDECSFNSAGTGTFRASENTNPFVGEQGKQHQEQELKIETIYPTHLENKILKALFSSHPYEEVAYDIIPLENKNPLVGSGMVGELEVEKNEKEFLNFLKEKMKTSCIKHTKLFNKPIKKVAVCGGAGSFLLKDAILNGADIFISSDFTYHQFFDAENKIIIADIGHYESEQFTSEIFFNLLKENFPDLNICVTEKNTNPVNCFLI